MLPPTHTFILKQICPLKHKYSSDDTESSFNDKFASRFNYRKTRTLSLSVVIAMLCFATVGCATLEALEPTAALINDLKKIL